MKICAVRIGPRSLISILWLAAGCGAFPIAVGTPWHGEAGAIRWSSSGRSAPPTAPAVTKRPGPVIFIYPRSAQVSAVGAMGHFVATASRGGTIAVWDLRTGEMAWSVQTDGPVDAVGLFDCRGRVCVAAARRSTASLEVWTHGLAHEDLEFGTMRWAVSPYGRVERSISSPEEAAEVVRDAPGSGDVFLWTRDGRLEQWSRDPPAFDRVAARVQPADAIVGRGWLDDDTLLSLSRDGTVDVVHIEHGDVVTFVPTERAGSNRDFRGLEVRVRDGLTCIGERDGESRACMIATAEGSWVTMTPDGFARRGGGTLDLLRFEDGSPLREWRPHVERSDVVAATLAGDPDGIAARAACALGVGPTGFDRLRTVLAQSRRWRADALWRRLPRTAQAEWTRLGLSRTGARPEIAHGKYETSADYEARKAAAENLAAHIDEWRVQRAFRQVFGRPYVAQTQFDADNGRFFATIRSDHPCAREFSMTVQLDETVASDDALEFDAALRRAGVDARLTTAGGVARWTSVAVSIDDITGGALTGVLVDAGPVAIAEPEPVELGHRELAATPAGIDDLRPLLLATESAPPDPHRFAFIIAVDAYDQAPPVRFAGRSGAAFELGAQRLLGVPPDQLVYLAPSEATGSKIKGELRKLLARMGPDDTLYFAFIGHGMPRADGEAAYLLPRDAVHGAFADEDFAMARILEQIQSAKLRRAFLFIDACFSGSVADETGEKRALFRGTAPVARVRYRPRADRNTVILSAGRHDQFANAYPDKGHRLFSYFLLRGLALGHTRADALLDYLHDQVRAASLQIGPELLQEPQLIGEPTTSIQ